MLSCCDSQVGTVLNQRDGKLRQDLVKVSIFIDIYF
jgi:hypothetical protein